MAKRSRPSLGIGDRHNWFKIRTVYIRRNRFFFFFFFFFQSIDWGLLVITPTCGFALGRPPLRLALGGRRTGSEAAGGGVSSGGLSDGSGIEMGDLGETGGSRSRGAGRPLWGDGAGFIHEAEPSLYERCIGRNLNKVRRACGCSTWSPLVFFLCVGSDR